MSILFNIRLSANLFLCTIPFVTFPAYTPCTHMYKSQNHGNNSVFRSQERRGRCELEGLARGASLPVIKVLPEGGSLPVIKRPVLTKFFACVAFI